jgi:hypothetical protein
VSGTQSGDCYAPGDILYTAERRGEHSGTALLGNLVESPIVVDYIKETHGIVVRGVRFALIVDLLLGTEWWDVGGKRSYFNFLVKNHPHLNRKQLDELKPEPARPDILTHNGPRYSFNGVQFSNDRNEYYEIKPDSATGLEAWQGAPGRKEEGKKYKLEKFYREFSLPYKKGSTYPAHPSKTKEIDLPLNRAFMYLANIARRRAKIKRIRVYMSVRRHEDGLLLYKVCFEIETDDKRKQQVLAKALAKWMYATYVVCHFPEKFQDIQKELGDYSFEGDKLPRIRCRFDVTDDLKDWLKAIEEQLYLRGIGLPGDKFLICCDEAYYWELVARRPKGAQGTEYAWQLALAKAKAWVNYASGSIGWAKVQPWIEVADKMKPRIKEKFPYHVQFGDAVIEYARAHPAQAIVIVSLPLMITAGVAILFEAGLLGAAVVGEGVVAESSAPVIGGFGRTALGEAVTTQALGKEVAVGASARGLNIPQIGNQLARFGGIGTPATDNFIVNTLRVLPRVIKDPKAIAGLAAGFLLGVDVKTAYAQTTVPADSSASAGLSALSPDAKPIADAVAISRLMLYPALEVPRNTTRPPIKEEKINLFNYAPIEKPFEIQDPKSVNIEMRYLGSVEIL